MKCPRCKFVSSDSKDICSKCFFDLRPCKHTLGLPITNPNSSAKDLRALLKADNIDLHRHDSKEEHQMPSQSSASVPEHATSLCAESEERRQDNNSQKSKLKSESKTRIWFSWFLKRDRRKTTARENEEPKSYPVEMEKSEETVSVSQILKDMNQKDVVPKVLEFYEDDLLLEQQLDEMLGEIELNYRAVKNHDQKVICPPRNSSTLDLDDELEISFEFEDELPQVDRLVALEKDLRADIGEIEPGPHTITMHSESGRAGGSNEDIDIRTQTDSFLNLSFEDMTVDAPPSLGQRQAECIEPIDFDISFDTEDVPQEQPKAPEPIAEILRPSTLLEPFELPAKPTEERDYSDELRSLLECVSRLESETASLIVRYLCGPRTGQEDFFDFYESRVLQIGTTDTAHISFPASAFPRVSPVHGIIDIEPLRNPIARITDLGSTSGIWVNNAKILQFVSTALPSKTLVRLGSDGPQIELELEVTKEAMARGNEKKKLSDENQIPTSPLESYVDPTESLWVCAANEIHSAGPVLELEFSVLELSDIKRNATLDLLFELSEEEISNPSIERKELGEIPSASTRDIRSKALGGALRSFSKQEHDEQVRKEEERETPANLILLPIIKPAALWRRGIGGVIDLGIHLLIGFVVVFLFFSPVEVRNAVVSLHTPDLVDLIPCLTSGILYGFFIWLALGVLLTFARGQTIGQSIVGLETVSVSSGPPTIAQSLLRTLGVSLTFLSLGLGLASMLIGNKQPLHDRLALTVVRANVKTSPS